MVFNINLVIIDKANTSLRRKTKILHKNHRIIGRKPSDLPFGQALENTITIMK